MMALQSNRSRFRSARELRNIHLTQLVPWLDQAGGSTLVRKGAVLFHEGELPEGLFYIKTGRVELTIGANGGRQMTTRIARRGQFLGLECLFANRPHEATARAIGPARVSFIPRAEFLAFLDENQDVQLRILHLLSEDVLSSYDMIRSTLELRHERTHRAGAPIETPAPA